MKEIKIIEKPYFLQFDEVQHEIPTKIIIQPVKASTAADLEEKKHIITYQFYIKNKLGVGSLTEINLTENKIFETKEELLKSL
jgi:uncharacterized protein YdaL